MLPPGRHLRTSLHLTCPVGSSPWPGCAWRCWSGEGPDLFTSGTTPSAFSLIKGTYANGSIVSVTGQPFSRAWQVNVTTNAPSSENVVLTAEYIGSGVR